MSIDDALRAVTKAARAHDKACADQLAASIRAREALESFREAEATLHRLIAERGEELARLADEADA